MAEDFRTGFQIDLDQLYKLLTSQITGFLPKKTAQTIRGADRERGIDIGRGVDTEQLNIYAAFGLPLPATVRGQKGQIDIASGMFTPEGGQPTHVGAFAQGLGAGSPLPADQPGPRQGGQPGSGSALVDALQRGQEGIKGATPLEGPRTEPLSEGLQAAESALAQQVRTPGRDEALQAALSGEAPQISLSPEDTAKIFEQSVLTPALSAFEREIAPRIRAGFSDIGTGPIQRARAVGEALGGLQETLTTELGQWQAENMRLMSTVNAEMQNRALDRQVRAAGVEGALAETDTNNLLKQVQGLATFQGIRQQALDRKTAEQIRLMPENNPYLWQVLGMRPQSGVSQGPSEGDPLQSAIIGLGLGAASGGIGSILGGIGGAIGDLFN